MADASRPEATHPPLDVPKPVAEGVWIVDGGPLHVAGLPIPVRMSVVRLPDGGLWLHSPTRHTPALQEALEAIGPIRHLVAPSVAHWTFLKQWQERCPGVATWAAPGLRERAPVRASGVALDHDLGDAPPADWAGVIDQVVVRGGGFAEVDFFHRPSRPLILTDLVQCLDGARLPWRARPFAWASGVLAPEGGTPLHLRLLLRTRRADTRAAAGRLAGFAPERVVFSHGLWFERDGEARLRRALAWILG